MTHRSHTWAAVVVGGLICASGAPAAVLSFSVADADAEVDVVLTDVPTGVQVDMTVDPSITGHYADIRGFFFDLNDDALLPGLGFSGSDVTDHDFDGVASNISPGNNMNPHVFEGGVTIGTPGASPDMHTTATFVLTHPGIDVAHLFGERVGIRATSVGVEPDGSGQTTSVKLVGIATPEPALLGLGGLAPLLLGRRRR